MSSEADFEELVEPGVEDALILRLRAASGRLCATTALKDGVQTAGLSEGAPAVAWGGADDADFASVTGWVAVSDMDGMGGELVPGVLLAAWWGGRLWLKYATEAPEAEAAEDEADSGAVYGSSGAMNDGMVVTREHGHGPALMVVPMTAREEFLKRDGKWRADVPWEVLAVYGAHPSGAIWAEDGSMAQERRVTLWMVPVGRAVCFMATSSDRYAEDGTEAPTAARMQYSEFGRAYDKGIDAYGGPHVAYWCALLPWEADGTEPWTGDDAAEWSEGYDPEAMCCGTVFDGLPTLKRDAFARPVSVCPRFHDSSQSGMFMAATGWTVAPASLTELFGVEGLETWTDALEYAMVTGVLSNVSLYETAQDYRFDPDSVEGLGLSAGYTAGYWVMSAECWPPVAEPYRVTLRAKVVTTGGSTLHLVCAGSEVDGVLLTSSLFAEEPSGFEWGGSGWGGGGSGGGGGSTGGGGGLDLPEKWEPEESEDNDDWPGPGPAPGPGEDEDVDEDSNPDNRISVQIGYEKGEGFKECYLTRRGGGLFWRLVLDGSYVEAALKGVEVPGVVTVKANGAHPAAGGMSIRMGLGDSSASVSAGVVTASAALRFRGHNQADVSTKSRDHEVTYVLDIDVEVEDKVWYLSASSASSAGSWVRLTGSDGVSNFQAKASAWYTWSVDRAALRQAAAAELKKRLTGRSMNDSGVSASGTAVVSAALSGSAARMVVYSILS